MTGQTNSAWYARQSAARLEDLLWMVETGECLKGAAERLNTTPSALEKWLRARGRYDLYQTLRRRDPIDPDRSLSDIGRAAAAIRWAS